MWYHIREFIRTLMFVTGLGLIETILFIALSLLIHGTVKW